MYVISRSTVSHKVEAKFPEFDHLIGTSEIMNNLYDIIVRVAPTDASIFLQGESGTGKELVAETIHKLSNRRNQPFVPVNCGALPPSLIEAELFGYERGSFTGAHKQRRGFFERASGGTLFLDEVTEMPIELQVHLLRVLETGKLHRIGGEQEITTNVRIIAATNRDPKDALKTGNLREDLFFRLSAFPLHIPALRHRCGDIRILAKHFLSLLNQEYYNSKHIYEPSLQLLEAYHWPGNVRELRNAVQCAFILADHHINPIHFPQCTYQPPLVPQVEESYLQFKIGTSIEVIEKKMIEKTLILNNGNKRITAEMLGLSLKTLYNRLNNYQLE